MFLGTGTPRLDPDRYGASAAVVVNGSAYLVDCGAGVVRRAAQAQRNGVRELDPRRLTHLFVTHLHSDHTVGYPDLILSPWVVGRTEQLHVYGPVGIAAMTRHILEAYSQDIEVRTSGLEGGNETGDHVDVHDIDSGEIFRDSNVTVSAFRVEHGSWKEALGFKFATADRTIVFSGDTAPCETLERAAVGVDVLVHEAYSDDEAKPEKRAGGEQWPAYLKAFHTSTRELGAICARTKPKLLILNHVLRRKATDADLVEEVREGGFRGKTIVAADLGVY